MDKKCAGLICERVSALTGRLGGRTGYPSKGSRTPNSEQSLLHSERERERERETLTNKYMSPRMESDPNGTVKILRPVT